MSSRFLYSGLRWSFCLIAILLSLCQCEEQIHMCKSEIFCRGPILEAVARLSLFKDSKEYVDRPLSRPPNEVLAEFKNRFGSVENLTEKHRPQLSNFIDEYFQYPGTELVPYVPDDWQPNPRTFDVIADDSYRRWAKDLHGIWRQLCKEVNRSITFYPDRYSLVYVPNHFIIPGGRFREYYNWDTLWILKGLLASEMFSTARSMIENFAYLVREYGFIPNGGRIYYLARSQPPIFAQMINDYYKTTGDTEFVQRLLPETEKELLFWKTHRFVIFDPVLSAGEKKSHTLFQYRVKSNVPRPESYREDITHAERLPPDMRPRFYSDIAASAESGWDFSSRFFDENQNDLIFVKTSRIIPVDLNAFICMNYKILSDHFKLNGQLLKSSIYGSLYEQMKESMMTVFYNETLGAWFDVDLDTKQHNLNFYPSNLSPLYAGCYNFEDKAHGTEKVLGYLIKSGAASFPDGIPTSLRSTDQQWDFPNGWPNVQHMIIEGFENTGVPKLQRAAFILANAWLKDNYEIFARTGYMFEKYDVTGASKAGTGGEYDVQIGFGWTNGVALDLLTKYGHKLKYSNHEEQSESDSNDVRLPDNIEYF